MRIEILDAAKQDFLDGFWFYEKQSEGVGRYFVDSLMADTESLLLYAGVHAKHFGYFRMLARRFPFAIYYSLKKQSFGSMRSSTVGKIRQGFETDSLASHLDGRISSCAT
jgi:hypothetical protein